MDEFDPDTNNSSVKKHFVESEKEIIRGLYSKSFSYTKHYNLIKMKYKSLLLGWVLATFVAFGYILSGKEVNAPLDKMLSIAIVAIFSSRGVLLFWFLDVEIYHRLLDSSFKANLEMEQEGLSQSRIHRNMMLVLNPEELPEYRKKYERKVLPSVLKAKRALIWLATGSTKGGLDPAFYDSLFYFGCSFCLWIIAGISLSNFIYYDGNHLLGFLVGILTPILSFIFGVHFIRKSIKVK